MVDIVVLPMGLQTPSAPSVLPLTPPLGSPCSVRFLTVSIHVCIGQDLTEPLRRQLYQAPVRKHFLASAIVSGFCGCIGDESPVGVVFRVAFPSVSAPLFVPVYPLDRSNSELKFGDGWVVPFLNQGPCLTSGYGLYRFSFLFVTFLLCMNRVT